MYNNFLVQKKTLQNETKLQIDRKMKKWTHNYHIKIQPQLLDKYNQRINSFITKIEENPAELQKFEAADIKKQKEEHMKQKISELSRKGGNYFKFRDAADFNSNFNEAERIQRSQNKRLFQRKYGDPDMAYRSIASQSEYNPSLMNKFRSRDKWKQINPPMKYTNKLQPSRSRSVQRKSKSVFENRKYNLQREQTADQDKDLQKIGRKNTSYTNSLVGTQDDMRSVNSIKEGSQSSQESQRNLKRFAVTLQNPRGKKGQSGKTYFNGITDIKQNSKDPHIKKTLHNILVKIGKTHPNPRDKRLASTIQVLSTQIN